MTTFAAIGFTEASYQPLTSQTIETKGNNMTTIPESIDTPPPSTRFTIDAEERMARIREMADAFPQEAEPVLLSPFDLRLARITSAAAIEAAAVFVQAEPEIGRQVADVNELRDAIAFEQAYAGVRDEALALARRVDMAIVRRKLQAALAARGVYRMAKSYATVREGFAIRPHVAALKRALVRPRRKKPLPPPVVELTAGVPPVKQ